MRVFARLHCPRPFCGGNLYHSEGEIRCLLCGRQHGQTEDFDPMQDTGKTNWLADPAWRWLADPAWGRSIRSL